MAEHGLSTVLKIRVVLDSDVILLEWCLLAWQLCLAC